MPNPTTPHAPHRSNHLADTSSAISCLTHSLVWHSYIFVASRWDPSDEYLRPLCVGPLGHTNYRSLTPHREANAYGSSQGAPHICLHYGHTFHGMMKDPIHKRIMDMISTLFNDVKSLAINLIIQLKIFNKYNFKNTLFDFYSFGLYKCYERIHHYFFQSWGIHRFNIWHWSTSHIGI